MAPTSTWDPDSMRAPCVGSGGVQGARRIAGFGRRPGHTATASLTTEGGR